MNSAHPAYFCNTVYMFIFQNNFYKSERTIDYNNRSFFFNEPSLQYEYKNLNLLSEIDSLVCKHLPCLIIFYYFFN